MNLPQKIFKASANNPTLYRETCNIVCHEEMQSNREKRVHSLSILQQNELKR